MAPTQATAALIEEARLRRFARLAASLLRGQAAWGAGPHAATYRPGPGLEFLDLRHYEPGDDIRHLDWRQSLRRRRPMIRRYRDESAADWFLCLDGSASMAMDADKTRLAAQLAAALSYSLLHAGHRVALIVFSDRIDGLCPLGRGAHQFARLSELLRTTAAKAAPGRPPSAGNASNLGLCQDALRVTANALVISDFLVPDAMEKDLKAVRARVAALQAIQVLGSGETQVPAYGPATLQDVETGKLRRVDLTPRSLARAQAALEQHRQQWQSVCQALAVRWTSCVAGQDWERVLLDHLRADH